MYGRAGKSGAALGALALVLAFTATSTEAVDAGRGKMLYEARCGACHDISVHHRGARKARTFDALRAQVLRWSAEAGGAWSVEEIDDVTLYLNDRFYRFPCPQRLCKAQQASYGR